MNIEISEEQFERLLKLVYLGNVMINETRKGDKEDPRIREYDEIEEMFLRLAHEKGDTDLVKFDIKTGKFYPSLALMEDEQAVAFMDRYIDDIFWEELAARLAERDVWEEIGEEVMSESRTRRNPGSTPKPNRSITANSKKAGSTTCASSGPGAGRKDTLKGGNMDKRRLLLISSSGVHGRGYLDHAMPEILTFLAGIRECSSFLTRRRIAGSTRKR